MNQAKVVVHTPGPWTVDECEDAYGNRTIRTIRLADGSPNIVANPIATVYAEANACLIAAAPEMFEALKRVQYFHRTDDTPNSDPWEDVRAAIAKAEGGDHA